ncbi:MAG: beta strand repeat-containing protein, partial [Pirellulales bacterium]
EGEIIEFTTAFPHDVFVAGTPQIAINVGGTVQQAAYVSGSGSTDLVFQYVIQDGEEDTNGITISGPGPAINLNGGTINDVVGDPALLTFTGPDTSTVDVDAVAPTVVSANGPVAGSYSNAAGDDLTITIVMDDAVTVTGAATIPLTIGGQSVNAEYDAVNSTSTTLVFSYTIEADVFANGTFTAGAIDLAGGTITIQDDVGNDADLTGFALNPTGVLINRTEPTVTVTDGDGETSAEGEIIEFTAVFPHSVTVTGTPQIGINVGGTVQQAAYVSGSGSTDLVFQYVIQDDEEDTNGITISGPGPAINLNGGTINDVAGDPALLTFTGPDTSTVLVDGVAPTVVSATGPVAGSYRNAAGDDLTITVVMDDAVTVTGAPTIPLTFSGQSVNAEYDAVNSTSTTLIFSYTIEADVFANGTFTVGAIDLAGGTITIQDNAGNDADLTFTLNPTGVLINRTEPTVTVTDGVGATSIEGEIIEFTAVFPHSVTVTGTPQIGINVGGTLQQADYAAGSGSETLQFRYVVQATDEDTNGITVPLESISLNGGTINDVAGDPALLTFTGPDTSTVLVDGVAPTVVSTFGPAAGSYGNGDNLDITVVMDDAVTVVTTAGTPIIELDINGRSRQAVYNAGASTSTTLVFRYPIASPTDVFANGTFTVGNISTAGGTIQDAIGNDADLAGYIAPTPANVLINRVEPTVTITDGDSDTSAAGEIIELTATYPQAVTVTGTPSIGINIGGTVRQATFSGGNNTTALRFQYEIVDGEEDTNGITIPGPAIELNAGTMTDPTGNVVLSFVAPDTSAAEVDAVAPTVVSANGPVAGSYSNSDDLEITVVMSEDVTVSGTPTIPLTIGGQVRNANYASGSGTTTLVFSYEIASVTDVYANGTIGVGNIILAGGTIRDAVTNEADLTGFTLNPTGVLINRIEPIVTVTDGDNTTNSAGDIIEFTVVFPHSVTVTGTPRIGINVGGTLQQADYAAGSGSETLQFRYVVQATDEDTNGITIPLESISLNGGTINDVAGDPALLTFTAPDTSNIDTVTAVLQGITVSDGTYANGETISLTATFDSVVTVDTTNGTPRIALNLDQGGVVFADYANTGSGTTALVFEYEVQTDDLDLTGITINDPILPNGGTILGFGGNDAVLTFTAPATDNVLVDAVGPVAVDIAPPTAGSYVTGQALSFAVDFDDNVEVAGTPLLPINIGGTPHNAEYVGGAGTSTLTFEHIILPTDQDGDGIVIVDPVINTGTITDAVGNAADFTTVNIPSTANVLVNTAVITTISASPDDLYVAGDTIRLTVIFSQPVNVDELGGTPGIALTVGSNAAIFADYVPGGSGTTTLVFEYEVQTGDVDTDGILVADRITLNGGEINDFGGAPAVLNFTSPDTTGILVDAEGPDAPTLITPAADNYLTGDTLTFNLVFAEPVQVTGSPRIPLEIGTNSPGGTPTERFAILSAGAGTDTLTFEYVIQPTDHDIDGLQINSPVDGLITDAFGNGADLTIPSLTDAGIRINPTKILSLGVSANGDYITGQHIDFTATFSEPVTVAGTPTIELTIGNTTISAVFQSGNGTDELTFRYVVNVNDTDEDGITLVTNTVDLGDPVDSSIVAVSDGGQAILTFTPPETSGITVNAVPRITAVATTTPDGAYDIDDIIDIQVTTSLPVKVIDAGNAKLELNTDIAGTDFATFIGSANVFTNTLVFQYIVQDGDYTADLDYLAIDS